MMDIKINGNTYKDVERVKMVRADGLGVYQLMDAAIFDCEISKTTYEDEYYNSAVTKVTAWPFNYIKKVNFPNVTSVGNNVFYSKGITEARLPSLESSPGGIFLSCKSLTKVVFGKNLSALGGQDLRACEKLATVVLPYNGVVTIPSVNSPFQDSGVAKGTGYVYVPKAQVDAYKADSTWSAYANQIRAIEDYPDEVA